MQENNKIEFIEAFKKKTKRFVIDNIFLLKNSKN